MNLSSDWIKAANMLEGIYISNKFQMLMADRRLQGFVRVGGLLLVPETAILRRINSCTEDLRGEGYTTHPHVRQGGCGLLPLTGCTDVYDY